MNFSRNGIFPYSKYCVTLQAKEIIKYKVHLENSTICVHVDDANSFDKLSQPLALKRELPGNLLCIEFFSTFFNC